MLAQEMQRKWWEQGHSTVHRQEQRQREAGSKGLLPEQAFNVSSGLFSK